MPRRRVAVVTAVLATALALAGGVVQHHAAHSWSAMQQRCRELEAAATAAPPDLREPFWGEARPGAARPNYERAVALAPSGADQHLLVTTLPMNDADAAAATTALREKYHPAVAALREGAHCRDGRMTVAHFSGEDTPVPDLLRLRDLVNLTMLEVRAARAAGESRLAVEIGLDAAAFAADHDQPDVLIHQMIGTALCAIACEAWTEDALAGLDADSLALLASGLARFDARLPTCIALAPEVRFAAAALATSGYAPPALMAWRYGFSTRWMVADAFLAYDALAAELRADGAPWPLRKDAFERAIAPFAASTNPFAAVLVPNLDAAEQNLRETVVHLRLLRIAVDLHRGLPAPDLADPLGAGALQVLTSDRGFSIRSQGKRSGRPLAREVRR